MLSDVLLGCQHHVGGYHLTARYVSLLRFYQALAHHQRSLFDGLLHPRGRIPVQVHHGAACTPADRVSQGDKPVRQTATGQTFEALLHRAILHDALFVHSVSRGHTTPF